MERGISIMDNEGFNLVGFPGEGFQILPTFFSLLMNPDLSIRLVSVNDLARKPEEAVSSPFQGFTSLPQLEHDGSEVGVGDAFKLGQALQIVNINQVDHASKYNNLGVDITTPKLFNSLVGRKGGSLEAGTSKESLPTPKNYQLGVKDMLAPIPGAYQHANIFLTPSVAGVNTLTIQPHPGDASLFEACDYCDSRAVEEVTSFHGDEEHIQFLCEKCWLMGFAPEVEEVAA